MRTVLAWVRGHRGLLLVAGCIVGIWWAFVFVVPNRLVQPNEVPDSTERSKQRQEERRVLLQTLTGVLVLGGAFVAWRQLQVTREGQITERFTRAIDQLGDDKVEVRLGAIYALERLARDSRVDERTITEVLCAYVRHHSPGKSHSDPQSWIASFRSLLSNRPKAEATEIPPLQARAGDVQAAMTVLGRRPVSKADLKDPREASGTLELRATDLRAASLIGADLRNANLREVDLQQAHLYQAKLQDAILAKADLREAEVDQADFRGADLQGADLRGVKNPSGANFNGAKIDDSTKRSPGFPGRL